VLRSHAVVVQLKNGELLAAQYRLAEDDFRHPRLRLLRTREHLDEVVAPGRNQLEKIVLLRHWAHRQWESGKRFYYPAWDAVEILDLARNHANRGFCTQYAIVFLQACQSLGLHARYVNLPGHFVVEVWSDEHNRWIIMDPMSDIHYERRGLPMTGRELFDSCRGKRWSGVTVAGADGSRRAALADDLAHYRSYAIDMDANQLSNPAKYRHNGEVRMLSRQEDYRRYPVMGRDTLVFWNRYLVWRSPRDGGPPLSSAYSSDPDDFRYPENQTVIVRQPSGGREEQIVIALTAGNSSTFRDFETRQDGGAWRTSPARFEWVLRPGLNRLACRIRSSFGWKGPESRMTVLYWPSLL